MDKKWLVRLTSGKIKGPFSEKEICKSITQMEFNGEEYIALYPSSSQWKNIASYPPFYDALFKVLSPTLTHKHTKASESIKLKNKGSFERVELNLNLDTDSKETATKSSTYDSMSTTKKVSDSQSDKTFQKINIRKSSKSDTSIIDLGREQPFMVKALFRKLFLPFVVIFAVSFFVIYTFVIPQNPNPENRGAIQLLRPKLNTTVLTVEENVQNIKRGLSFYLMDQVSSYRQAQDSFIQAIEGDSKNAIPLGYLCLTYFELWPFTSQNSDDIQSIAYMTRKAETVNQGGIYSAICRIVQHLTQEKVAQAASLVKTSIEELSYNRYSENLAPFFYYLRSHINFQQLKYAQALQDLDNVQTLLPHMLRSYTFAAYVAQQQKQYNKALKFYSDALKQNPQHKTSLLGTGILLHNYLEQYSQGEKVIRRALNLPDVVLPQYLASSYFILAKSAFKINDQEEFRKYAEQAYALDSTNKELQQMMNMAGMDKINNKVTNSQMKSRLLIEKGDQLARAGSFFEARSYYQQAFQVDQGKNSLAAVKVAETLWKSGLSLEAIDWLQKAIEADGQIIRPYILMSNYYSHLYEMDKATQVLKVANSKSPNNLDVFKGYALLNLRQNHIKTAIAYAQKALNIYESDVEAYNILAKAYYLEGQYTESLKMATRGKEIDSNNQEAQIHYARALGKIYGVDTAFSYLEDLISNTQEGSQSHIDYVIGLAQFLYENEDYADALNSLKTISHLEEQSLRYYLLLGKTYSQMDSYIKLAREQFLKAALINPSDPEVMYELSQLLMKFRQYDEALTHLKKILEFYPRYPKIRFFIARILAKKGGNTNLKKALKELKEEEKIDPDAPEPYQLTGDIYDRLGDYTLCAQSFQKAIDILPHDSELYVRSAICYRKAGDLELALQLLKAISGGSASARKRSSNPKVYRELGAIYEMKRDYLNATKSYAIYLDILPNAKDKKQIEKRVQNFGL